MRDGFRNRPPRSYEEKLDGVRRLFDEERPSGWPSHTRSFFAWPSFSDKWKYGPRVVVLVDPASVPGRCVAADLTILERAVNDTYEEPEKRDLARRYWSDAVSGSLSDVNSAARRFEEPEIFCAPPVPARAFSIMR